MKWFQPWPSKPTIHLDKYMTQMFHLIVKELTFANMKLYVIFFKSSKHLLQMMHMNSYSQSKNDDVIYITFGKAKSY